jgi:hypothetical protein
VTTFPAAGQDPEVAHVLAAAGIAVCVGAVVVVWVAGALYNAFRSPHGERMRLVRYTPAATLQLPYLRLHQFIYRHSGGLIGSRIIAADPTQRALRVCERPYRDSAKPAAPCPRRYLIFPPCHRWHLSRSTMHRKA